MKEKILAFAIILLLASNISSMQVNSVPHLDIPLRKGEYATGSIEGKLGQKELEWLSKFEIVHAGSIEEPLTAEQINYLRSNGVKIIMADDWLPAGYYYPWGNNTPFMEWVYENRYNVTLNPDGPFPHCWENGYDWQEYYFDFAVHELVEKRVEYIVNGLKKNGYNAIFFDWGNGLFLEEKGYESINATYHEKHPSIPYSQAASLFIAEIRNKMPEIVIENNQGFREAEYYLPVLDYDMAESYITGCNYYGKKLYIEKHGLIEVPQTVYYPVSENELEGSLNDTIYYLNYLSDLRAEYAGKDFKKTVYMNYAAPDFVFLRHENGYDIYKPTVPKNAIYFGYATAKLVGQISYTEVPWNHSYERCDVYFYDIGSPLGETYEKIDGGYIRYYTNGFVIVGDWKEKREIVLRSRYIPSYTPFYDAFEGKWGITGDKTVSVDINPVYDNIAKKMVPCGRVFVYAEKPLNVSIIKPNEGHLYIMDREMFSIPSEYAIIIGKITVEAIAKNASMVEFYIDDELKYEDESPPYQWQWNAASIGKHEIKVIAYNGKNKAEDKKDVFKIGI